MAESETRDYYVIGSELLPAIIERHVGIGAKLISWESKYFTKSGEHYIGKVKSIICVVSYQEKTFKQHYIVKVNPRRQLDLFQNLTHSLFVREGRFYEEAAQELQRILSTAKCKPLSIPTYLLVKLELNNEVILMNDLRRESYETFNRLNTLDLPHILIVIKELAKLHAASYILHIQKKQDLSTVFPFMKDFWLHEEYKGAFQYITYCKTRFASVLYALEGIASYSKVLSWLKKEEDNLMKYYVDALEQTSEKFKVICHGDIWISNMMFRYNDQGKPDSVILLDFQQCRIASVATDIHLFLIASASGDTRREHLDTVLHTYYESFSSVFHGFNNINVPFTQQELKEEYVNKVLFGCLSGMIRLPLMLVQEEEAMDLNNLHNSDVASFCEAQRLQLSQIISADEGAKRRFLAIFHDSLMYDKFNS